MRAAGGVLQQQPGIEAGRSAAARKPALRRAWSFSPARPVRPAGRPGVRKPARRAVRPCRHP
jgi:hypothetical protein